MTTPQEMINKYERTPFDLYHLRGKQFTILEDLPVDGDMRQVRKNNKWDKLQDFFFLKIEEGLFQKDLEMTENEMLALFVAMPKAIKNYRGAMVAVDQGNKMKLTYVGNTDQDMQGHKINVSTVSSAMTQPVDQKDMFVNKLIAGIKAVNDIGTDVFASDVMRMADKISPGNALQVVKLAKDKGLLSEQTGGIYTVN